MENNKVGLCLAHTGTNYGQLLQAYATQQVIERMGFETEIIKYYSGHNKGIALSPASIYVALKQMYTLVRKRVEARKKMYRMKYTKKIKKCEDRYRKISA